LLALRLLAKRLQVVGTVAFVVLQGMRFGPQAHTRYFQLKGMSGPQKERHVEAKKAAYTSFGVPAVLLEMVCTLQHARRCFIANQNDV
jgi:hypothetical protein